MADVEYLEIGERPWGKYYVLVDQANHKVKRLVVNPGKRLSLQSHEHRSEHWVVVEGVGTFEIHVGDDPTEWVKQYHPEDHAYIPKRAKHRIHNKGTQDLVIIEVQCGNYTGEDDITRYEDDFGRVEG
jgi:mannose-6-phosphate isomerase-like protein (cupin superfamily)